MPFLDFNLSDVGKSNVAYTDEEASHIRHARLHAQGKLIGLNAEIAALELRLQELEGQRQRVKQDITHYDVALVPHKMLPEEILRWIFILCADEIIFVESYYQFMEKLRSTSSSFSSPSSSSSSFRIEDEDDEDNVTIEKLNDKAKEWIKRAKNPQFALINVCRAWRRVAVATPELWAVYVCEIDLFTMQVTKWIFGLTHTLKSLALHLHYSNLTDSLIFPLFTRHRYKKLELYLDSTRVPQLKLIPLNAVSELQELGLDISTGFMDGVVITSLQLTSHRFPLVSELKLTTSCDPPIHITLPYQRLRHLDLSEFPLYLLQCLNILRKSPLLEDVKFYVQHSDHLALVTEKCINTSLQELQVRFINGAESQRMFHCSRFPNLTKLVISAVSDLHWTAETYPLLNHHFNFRRLQTFELGETTSVVDANLLLQQGPFLQSLKLPPKTKLSNETMNGLSTGQLGPRLHTLTACVDLDMEKVFSMVESRWKNSLSPTGDHYGDGTRPTPLRVVCLFSKNRDEMPEKFVRRQRKLEKLGVYVGACDPDDWY
ncbi:hypothetical protein AMATHDRAFT_2394 [Amanita thiersii Skay4041]|uniref:F-box domain-containing protein n=1 Tax=Amanita thiersii Skay4041 TaxID=703135 RepID=A0A2A9NWE9_9AGAR|nr:hypothetical protein AMATHDRAFT_2394 [Amanita thiersii Skay4041]